MIPSKRLIVYIFFFGILILVFVCIYNWKITPDRILANENIRNRKFIFYVNDGMNIWISSTVESRGFNLKYSIEYMPYVTYTFWSGARLYGYNESMIDYMIRESNGKSSSK
jgi:hypothetical protein